MEPGIYVDKRQIPSRQSPPRHPIFVVGKSSDIPPCQIVNVISKMRDYSVIRGPTSRRPSSQISRSAQRKGNSSLSFSPTQQIFLCGICSSARILRETVPPATDRGPDLIYRRGTISLLTLSEPPSSPLRFVSISPRYGKTTPVPIDRDVCRGTSRRCQRLVRRS